MALSSEVVKLLEQCYSKRQSGVITTYRKAKVETFQEKNGVLILTPSHSGQEIVTKPSGSP